jgi:hypothetical protein
MMPRRVKKERSLAPQMAWSASSRASRKGMAGKIGGDGGRGRVCESP